MNPTSLTLPRRLTRAFSAFWGGLYDNATLGRGQRYRHTILTDTKRALASYDWQRLLSLGRQLYCNLGEVRGPVLEKAMYAVGNGWIPQFYGEDQKWGERAEQWLNEHLKICDVRGEPYDFRTGLYLASVAMDRDGDVGLVLTESDGGYPMLQWIPAHRIGWTRGDEMLTEGPYRGLSMCNGVIFNALGRAVAYRVYDEIADVSTPANQRVYRDISARDMALLYQPDFHDAGRGVTAFAHAIKSCFDYLDVHEYERQAVKLASSIGLVEMNESGEADVGKNYITNSGDISAAGVRIEDLDGGSIRYFRANSGADLKPFVSDRPAENVNEFLEVILRGVYQGIGWPYEFTRDASKIGGANVRQIIDKVKRTILCRQQVLMKAATRYAGYSISKAVKLGLIPRSDEWWKWTWQLPEEPTVDLGRESQQDRENFKLGMGTLKQWYGKQGRWWVDEIEQRLFERAYVERRCKELGIDPRGVQLLTPNEIATDEPPTREGTGGSSEDTPAR